MERIVPKWMKEIHSKTRLKTKIKISIFVRTFKHKMKKPFNLFLKMTDTQKEYLDQSSLHIYIHSISSLFLCYLIRKHIQIKKRTKLSIKKPKLNAH